MKPCGDACFSIMVSPVVLTTAPPSLKELSNALSSVTKWYTLGVKLGLESHDLATIQQDYPHDSNRCRDEMIACCLRGTNPPTWKTTADALCQMGEHHLADKIRTKHPGSFTTIGKHLLVLCTLDACLCASVHCTIEMCNNIIMNKYLWLHLYVLYAGSQLTNSNTLGRYLCQRGAGLSKQHACCGLRCQHSTSVATWAAVSS